jgi:hypothetical protein
MKKLIVIIGLFTLTLSVQAQSENYKFKCLFINNFIKNIKWPDSEANMDFMIGVLEDDVAYKEVEEFFRNRTINNRTIKITRITNINNFSYCHVLFIPNNSKASLNTILTKTNEISCLLITEKEGWAKKGSMINFVSMDDGGLKYELNYAATEKHNIKVPNSIVSLSIKI